MCLDLPFSSLGGSYVYELSAVLIHRGVSAYSGHYIAHVKDPQSGEWYKFNDEDIEKMEGKKLQLGIEEDLGKTFKLWVPFYNIKFFTGIICHRLL